VHLVGDRADYSDKVINSKNNDTPAVHPGGDGTDHSDTVSDRNNDDISTVHPTSGSADSLDLMNDRKSGDTSAAHPAGDSIDKSDVNTDYSDNNVISSLHNPLHNTEVHNKLVTHQQKKLSLKMWSNTKGIFQCRCEVCSKMF
jgi:hypothetical protein